MANSTAGALKAHLETQGLGVPIFRDEPGKQANGTPQPFPYITITEGVAVVPEPAFNPLSDTDGHVDELAQVDVWQRLRDPTTRAIVEDPALPRNVLKALHGVRRIATPTRSYLVSVDDSRRLFERQERQPDRQLSDDVIIHQAITVRIRRRG